MSIILSDRLICDLEMLLNGGFFPLTGFMNSIDYNSVVNNMRLANGQLWPIPIVLPNDNNQFKINDTIILKDKTNLPLAKLYIEDIFKPDIDLECNMVYGTNDTNHPYVEIVKSYGNCYYIGGKVKQINSIPHFDFLEDRLTPAELKQFFKDNGWGNDNAIVGFQTRNPMHRSHLELTKYALKEIDPTGNVAKLLVHPVVGVTQDCDVDYHTRVRCYKKIMNQYPEGLAKLSLLPLSMRMAGPKEALWHALIRQNYGCTHFIVGRDHAGPSSKTKEGTSFYGPYDAHHLLDSVKDELNIKIVQSKMIVYVKEINDYMPIDTVPANMTVLNISGTEQRRLLKTGLDIPEWFTYPDIVEELRREYVVKKNRGFCIYLVGLSGSGKTTIANSLMHKLKEVTSRPITVLDGDIVRNNLSKGLGFTKEDRSINVKRIGYVASEIVKHHGIVICANIAPYNDDREYNRKLISKYGGYIEVYMNTPIDICEERDVKGLYKLARDGKIKEFTGISDPFEEPVSPEVIINTYNGYNNYDNHNSYNSIKNSVQSIYNKIVDLGYL